jgi:hypothetical protein
MRVLEFGLRGFEEYLDLPMNGKLEFENLKNIIDQIEAKIRGCLGRVILGPTVRASAVSWLF